jgi:hypothetical protein
MTVHMPTMPDILEVTYDKLFHEVCKLQSQWQIYMRLFSSQSDVDLLNRTAPFFFYTCQDILADSIMLKICRLTDAATSKVGNPKRENLSLYRLADLVKQSGEHQLHTNLMTLLTTLDTHWKPHKARRDRDIAHADYLSIVNGHAHPLPMPTVNDTAKALRLIHEIMNEVNRHYRNVETAYDILVLPDGDALFIALKHAEVYRRQLHDYLSRDSA